MLHFQFREAHTLIPLFLEEKDCLCFNMLPVCLELEFLISLKNSWLNYPVTSLTFVQNYPITMDPIFMARHAKSCSQNQTLNTDHSHFPCLRLQCNAASSQNSNAESVARWKRKLFKSWWPQWAPMKMSTNSKASGIQSSKTPSSCVCIL